MTRSLRRLSHLWLAVVSGIFLLIASITGAVLSVEPVYEGSFNYDVRDADNLTLSQLIARSKKSHPEILSIKRDHNAFIQVTAFGEEGEETFYMDPLTGEKLGALIETPKIFDFCRTLHRSLFFGSLGRFMVGLTSLMLLLISMTGFFLILKKQGGIRNYFKKTIKDEFYRDTHTRLGKPLFLFVSMIGVTGGYLFLERFGVVTKGDSEHHIAFEELRETPSRPLSGIPTFQNTSVSQLREISFPFSEFVDDFFELKLKDRELLINQVTGDVVSEIRHPVSKQLSMLSFSLHTGEGQPWWAALLGFTSMSILFFLFSGFKIYFKRTGKKANVDNPFSKEESTIIVGFGTEMGSTAIFAQVLHEALLDAGKKSFLLELNAFGSFPSMKQLIVVTSTYGLGEPPTNASHFIKKLRNATYDLPFHYAIVGFGSVNYPDFCQFAVDVDHALKS
ncbi:MAG: PepSY domain-containing protein, partial [Bacteroidota bacterium]